MQSQSKFLKDFPGGMPPDPLVRACYAYCMSVFCTQPILVTLGYGKAPLAVVHTRLLWIIVLQQKLTALCHQSQNGHTGTNG